MRTGSSAVAIEVIVEPRRTVIRCRQCGVEQVLWTRRDLASDGLVALFTDEHLVCTPRRRRGDD